jgi:hypothetical protein
MNRFRTISILTILISLCVVQVAYGNPVRIGLHTEDDVTGIKIIQSDESTDSAVTVRVNPSDFDTLRMGENLTVPEGTVRKGDVAIFGGNGDVRGKVVGDIVIFGGSIVISGTVTGDAVVFGGTVDLKSTAKIQGSMVSLGGSVNREEGAFIGDDAIDISGIPFMSSLSRWISRKVDASSVDHFQMEDESKSRFGALSSFHLIAIFIWFLVICISVVLFSRNIERAGDVMRSESLKSLVAGFLFHTASLILLLGLTITVIGLPLALLLLIFWAVVCMFSVPVGCYVLGKRIWELFSHGTTSIFVSAVTGLVILGLVRYIPFFLGFLIWHLWFMAGVGAAVMSKFGSMKPWFKRSAPSYAYPHTATHPHPPSAPPSPSPDRYPDTRHTEQPPSENATSSDHQEGEPLTD